MVMLIEQYLRRLRRKARGEASRGRGAAPPPGDSLTAALDNERVEPALLAAFRAACARRIDWEPAGAKDALIFADSGPVSALADEIVALGDDGERQYWLLRNDWSGFPDPSEFVLVGFGENADIAALGHFEDWPEAWPMDGWLRERLYHQSDEI